MILGPNRKHHDYAAIYADDDKEEDAAEHVEEHNKGRELTHKEPKDPVRRYAVDNVKRQTSAEDEVRHSQTQVPGSVDWLLHAKTCNPDNQPISSNAKQEDDYIDDQKQQAQNLCETCCVDFIRTVLISEITCGNICIIKI